MEDLFEKYEPDWSDDSLWLFATPSETARNIYFYIQECGHFKANSAYYTERKNLDSYLAIYTLGGNGCLTYCGCEYELGANSLCIIDCREHHKYKCGDEGIWDFLWFHFNGICAGGYYGEFVKPGFAVIPDAVQIQQVMRRIVSLVQNRHRDSEVLASAAITEVMAFAISANSGLGEEKLYIPHYISKALEYIEQNYHDAITIKSLCDTVGYSNEHFTREFRKYMGTNVREYIVNRRMNAAKELLQHTDLSIEEIAQKIGMGGASRFIELFRHRELITPLAYRHKWRNMVR